jgi:hypothetical protein
MSGLVARFVAPALPWRPRGTGTLFALLILLHGCAGEVNGPPPARVAALRTADGVQLIEGASPVLFYRSRPLAGREPWRLHYVHPLYSVGGAIVTEDSPPDHIHHRGVFWAWRRILVDHAWVADGWVGDRLVLEPDTPRVRTFDDGSAQIDVRVRWLVPLDGRPTPIIEENSSIRAYPAAGGRRRVDFSVGLRALRPGVELAGTDDEKGYGGISMRFANPQLVEIRSDGRVVHATLAGMETGPRVEFAWRSLPPPWPPSVSARCTAGGQPWMRWVLRQEPSMQNCAFPGAIPVVVPTDSELRLGVSLIVG